MQLLLWLILLSYAVVVLLWAYGCYYVHRLDLSGLRLAPCHAWPPDRPAPSLAIILACHNEERDLEPCLQHLLAQPYPNLRVIVADDRSTDRTGPILAALAASDPRIQPVTVRALPSGWIGKTHALSRATAECDTEYILFVDTDVRLAPHALLTVMNHVLSDQIEFLSLWPRLELRSLAEQLLTPPTMFLLSLWALPRRRASDVATQTVLGNGQFLLVQRRAYESLGGHSAVGDELAEDAVLAAKAHAAGLPCWSGLGAGVLVSRREGDFQRTVHSIARVMIGSLQTHQRMLVGTQILLAGGFAAAWIPPLAILGLLLHAYPATAAAALALGILHWILLLATLHRAFALTLVRRGPLFWFPLGSALCAGVLFWSAWLASGRGRIRWGNTHYRLAGSRAVAIPKE